MDSRGDTRLGHDRRHLGEVTAAALLREEGERSEKRSRAEKKRHACPRFRGSVCGGSSETGRRGCDAVVTYPRERYSRAEAETERAISFARKNVADAVFRGRLPSRRDKGRGEEGNACPRAVTRTVASAA